MEQHMMTIHSNQEIANQTFEMKLFSGMEEVSLTPGQFLHIKVGMGNAHSLRRPISIADYEKETGIVTIVFKLSGEGTRELSQYIPGNSLDVLFPCGTGYPIEKLAMKKALLVGGGIGVPPLYYLAKNLKAKGIEITSFLGFQNSDQIFYEDAFCELGNTSIITQDGSNGQKGLVTDLIAAEEYNYDYFFTCGPTGMLRAVSGQLAGKNGFVSVEQRMGCGIGACYACVIPAPSTPEGFKKICKDGPVFTAEEVVL